jgi:hypothetical protein
MHRTPSQPGTSDADRTSRSKIARSNVLAFAPTEMGRTLPMGSVSGIALADDLLSGKEAYSPQAYAMDANAALDLAASLHLGSSSLPVARGRLGAVVQRPSEASGVEHAPAKVAPVLATPIAMATPTPMPATAPSAGNSHSDVVPVATKPPLFDVMKLNKSIVSSYKFMGFAILGTILLGLGSFIATNLFYIFNESWVTPMELSSTDPRVLQLNAQYSAEKAARDSVATQRLELASRLADAQRTAVSEGKFQKAFDEAMKADLEDRNGELAGFRRLIADIKRTRNAVTSVNHEFTSISKDTLKQEYAAHLINKDDQVKGGYELAEIEGSNLSLHQKNVEIDARVTDLKRQVASLEAAGTHGSGAMSYEILHMRHEYEQSVLASQKATDDADALTKSIDMLDATLGEYDTQLARIAKAPYVMAADKAVNTAFVPYDNVGAVQIGDKVYGCAVGFVWCHSVGTVAEVLDGEVLGKHPLHNRELRGILVRLTLTDPRAIEKPVLQLHRAPLGI